MAQDAASNPPQTDDGQQALGEFTKAEQDVRLQKASEYYNLCQDIDEGQKREIGQEIKQGYTDDNATRSDWLEMHEFWLRLYMQTDSAQTSDSERDWGATESIPILTEACDQFQGRSYKAFFPNPTFVSAVPTSHTMDPQKRQANEARADRIGRHISWQLGIKNKNYRKDKRALFLGVAVHGSFFTKTYFNTYKGNQVCIDNIRPTDLVINYDVGPKRIEDVRRKSHVIYTTIGDTEQMVQKGFLFEPAKGSYGSGQHGYNKAVDESQGLNPSRNTLKRDQEAVIVEQQFYYDIDGKGVFMPYLGTIDLGTGRLLRLVIDYEADQNGQPLKDYEQMQYYTHYKFSENPDGFYGLGLGQKIGDLNSAVNIGTRQMLDAATLSNDGNNSGYISERLCVDGEDEVQMTLGKLKKIPDTTGDLQNGIMMMKFPGPSQSLLNLVEMLDQRAQRMASTTDATTGDISKNMQPTTVLAQIEQAMEMFSASQMGLADDLGDELDKVYHLNQKHLPLVEYFTINDVPDQVTRMDYTDDMTIEPIFDPKFSTQMQKVQRAQAISQIVMANPLTQQRPEVMDALAKMNLEALDADNIDELVPTPPPPANIDDQMKENMLFMMPPQSRPSFDVYPNQDHQKHLDELHDFIATEGNKLQPEQQQAVIAHKQKHDAMIYGIKNGIIPNPQNTQAQPGGPGGMANGPSNAMGVPPGATGIPYTNGAQALN